MASTAPKTTEFARLAALFHDAAKAGAEADFDALESRAQDAKRVAEEILDSGRDNPEGVKRLYEILIAEFNQDRSDFEPTQTLLYHIGWDLIHHISPLLRDSDAQDAPSQLLRAISAKCNPREVHMIALERLSFLELSGDSDDTIMGNAKEFLGVAEALVEATGRIKKGKNSLRFAANTVAGIVRCLEYLRNCFGKLSEARIEAEFAKRGKPPSVEDDEENQKETLEWPLVVDSFCQLYLDLADFVIGATDDLSAFPLVSVVTDDKEVNEQTGRRYLGAYLGLDFLDQVGARMPMALSESQGNADSKRCSKFVDTLLNRLEPVSLKIPELLNVITASNLFASATGEHSASEGDLYLSDLPLSRRFPLSTTGLAVFAALALNKQSWKVSTESDKTTAVSFVSLLFELGCSEESVEAADKALLILQKLLSAPRKLTVSELFPESDPDSWILMPSIHAALICMSTTPSPRLRTAIFGTLSKFAAETLDDQARLHWIGYLLQPTPHAAVAVAGVSILKDAIRTALDGHGGLFASKAVGKVIGEVLMKLGAPVYGGSAMEDRHGVLMHAMNLYVYLLARDKENLTGIRDPANVAAAERDMFNPLRSLVAKTKEEAERALAKEDASDRDKESWMQKLLDADLAGDMIDRADSLKRK